MQREESRRRELGVAGSVRSRSSLLSSLETLTLLAGLSDFLRSFEPAYHLRSAASASAAAAAAAAASASASASAAASAASAAAAAFAATAASFCF
eukprot:763335-Hanusia_phi.AAC.1